MGYNRTISFDKENSASANAASRDKLRDKLNDDIQAFLQQGGEIKKIEPRVMADPPKRPESNYGSRPI